MKIFLLLASTLSFAQSWSAVSNTAITTAICPANGASGSQCISGFDACSGNGGDYPYQTICNQLTRAYNGCAARKKEGSEAFFCFGGGHQASVDNSVYEVRLYGTPTAVRVTNPSQYLPADDTSDCKASLSDGQPNSRHTNSSMVYVPTMDRIYTIFGSLACALGKTRGDIWYLSSLSSSPTWTQVTPHPSGFIPSYDNLSNAPAGVALSAWDPASEKIYFTHSYKFYSLNPSDNMITQLSSNITAVEHPQFSKAFIDTRRNNFWEIGESKSFRISIAGGSSYSWEAVTLDSSCNTLRNGDSGAALEYDSIGDRAIGWFYNGGATVHYFNPAALTCTSQSLSGSAPTNGSEIHSIYTRGALFPSLNIYAVINDFGINVYKFSLDVITRNSPKVTGPVKSTGKPRIR